MDQQIVSEAVKQLHSIAEGINNPWTIIVQVAAILVALGLGLMGIFQDWIRGKVLKPSLSPVEIKK